jgi:hypothetical protein
MIAAFLANHDVCVAFANIIVGSFMAMFAMLRTAL